MSDESDPIGERIRAASRSVSAPLALREAIGRAPQRAQRQYPSRLRILLVGGILATIATASTLLAPRPPSVESVAAATLKAPQRPAPHALEGYLPGFRAIGARTDTIAGRRAVTIIYRRGATGVHYTVIDGNPLKLPGTRRARVGSLELALDRDGGTAIVAWHARGKTCILATDDGDQDDLVSLLRRA